MNSHLHELGMSNIKIVFIVLAAVFTPIVMFVGFVIVMAIMGHQASVKAEQAAIAAKQARLTADPISENNLYIAINKKRAESGAPSLQNVSELSKAALALCHDMKKSNYFDYTNPVTKKEANSFITDTQGEMYYKYYVSSIAKGDKSTQTATDVIAESMKAQANNLADPKFNSIGWSICADPAYAALNTGNNVMIVAALAEVAERPVAPTTIYQPQYVAPAPTYTAPRSFHCDTTEYQYIGGSSTSCYSY